MKKKSKLYLEAFRTVFATQMMFWNAIVLPAVVVVCYHKPDGLLLFVSLWVIATALLTFFLTRSVVSEAACALDLLILAKGGQKLCWYMTIPYLLMLFVICPESMLIFGGLGLLVAWANAKVGQSRALE